VASTIEWFLDGVIIANQQNDTLTPLSNGNYHVQITDPFGCTYSTSNFQVDVSVTENTFGHWIIYPNPVKDVLSIQVDEAMIGATVELMDLNSRLIRTLGISHLINHFDIEDIPNGVYYIQMKMNDHIQLKKIVIE
jgi:hypothetical protein